MQFLSKLAIWTCSDPEAGTGRLVRCAACAGSRSSHQKLRQFANGPLIHAVPRHGPKPGRERISTKSIGKGQLRAVDE